MRRLWVLVLAISLMTAVSQPLHAQTTSSTQITIDQLIKHAEDGVFQENIYALTNEKNSGNNGTPGTVQYQNFLKINAAEMSALIKARTAFENTITQQGTSKTLPQLYSDALLAAVNSLESDKTSNSLLQQGSASKFIDNFKQQLTTEAANQEWIKAITTGQPLSAEAQTAANATKAAANPSASNTSKVDDCSFIKGNILPCIDQATAWIIKNTLLQLAGFLVWLTASMLNFAIKTGILEFAQWAPNTLYPLWIIIRQIVSLTVVFAGLWLGFMYIIGREDTFTKYVGWVVVFALFVNFSYPVTRALIDVSNVISLNVYSSSVGSELLTGTGTSNAGSLMLNKIGLQGLLASAVQDETSKSDNFVKSINSTPGALLAVVFALYAAYVFFMATAIIAARTAVLVFLTVASPLLLVDAVVPKLGDVAMKMRKMYLEQLIVAPLFMIMFALTMKFLDIFQNPLFKAGGDAVATFFGILMMLIMLHIMLKVTKSVAGNVGETATNWIGKVGGFGIGLATGGAGMLARGSIGAAAARVRDSSWMNNAQDSRLGRGLYTLSNSLAQSTYDARNIGMVSKGLATAGITGAMGVTAQQGLKQTYDQRFTTQKESISKRAAFIKDAGVRERYLDQMTKTPSNRAQGAFLGAVGKVTGLKEEERLNDAQLIKSQISSARVKALNKYNSISDPDKKAEYLDSLTGDTLDYVKRGGKAPDIKTGPVEGVAPTPSEKVEETSTEEKTQQTVEQNSGATIDTEHPGGSNMSQYESKEYEIPAVARKQMGPQLPANGIRTTAEAREMTETEKVNMMNSYRAKFAQSKGKEDDAGAAASTTPKPTTPPTSGTTTPEDRTSTV